MEGLTPIPFYSKATHPIEFPFFNYGCIYLFEELFIIMVSRRFDKQKTSSLISYLLLLLTLLLI